MKINNDGFTLIELLAVILILSIILGIAVFVVGNVLNTASDNIDTIERNNLEAAGRAMLADYLLGTPMQCTTPFLAGTINRNVTPNVYNNTTNDPNCNATRGLSGWTHTTANRHCTCRVTWQSLCQAGYYEPRGNDANSVCNRTDRFVYITRETSGVAPNNLTFRYTVRISE